MEIKIPLHSFVALITNSSSEVFVVANHKTIDSVKKMITSILKSGGSEQTCDDLFDITLIVRDGGYGDYTDINVHARDIKNKATAELVSSLSTMFSPENIGND